MRIALCDQDPLMRDLVEALVFSAGHEVVGIADTTVAAVGLIEAGRPDAVIVDLSLGYNTDFDVIASAIAVGARVIVFSLNADAQVLSRYAPAPTVVFKPDLTALEQVLGRLDRDADSGAVVEHDRRQRPSRAASGPQPTGVGNAQAFFEAINDAQAGDGMVSIDVPRAVDAVAPDIARLLRGTDRLLAFPAAIRLYLPGGGEVGILSLLRRLWDAGALSAECRASSIVVRDGELGADAFDRLKSQGEVQELGPAAI